MPHLELAAFNPSSALLAISTGIARIELGADPSVGGVTPELSTFTQLSAGLKDAVPINIMVRPRGGGFLYNSSELSSIESSMSEFIAAGASVECGFVFGALTCTPSGMKVDEEICTSLIRLASGRRCIFHRAFDQIPRVDMEEELEVLIRCGFSAVLTRYMSFFLTILKQRQQNINSFQSVKPFLLLIRLGGHCKSPADSPYSVAAQAKQSREKPCFSV